MNESVVKKVEMVALQEKEKKAFYQIFLLKTDDGYLCRRFSGSLKMANYHVTESFHPSREDADKKFSSCQKKELSPKGPRQYECLPEEKTLFRGRDRTIRVGIVRGGEVYEDLQELL